MTNVSEKNNTEEKLQNILQTEQLAGTEEIIKKAFLHLIDFSIKTNQPERVDTALDVCAIALHELNLATDSTASILLKNVVESSAISREECVKDFGEPVFHIISGLQKIELLDTTKYHSNAENFIKLLLTISDDIRVILVRLAELMNKLRHLEKYPPEQQQVIAGEASLLYLQIAHRLGLYKIKTEIEDRVMKFFKKNIYEDIEQKIKETQKDRDKYIHDFIAPIEKGLKEFGLDCEIKGRVKSIPSIWKKMQTQKVNFERVYDLFAIRIIVDKIQENEKADCWKVYSIVTDLYQPNPRRLRDWISYPKTTGYESLHTTVIGPEGKWVEVQIRTTRMDDVAERGFAAHWKYKNAYNKNTQTDWFAEVRRLLENSDHTTHEKGFSEAKQALYTDEIFIFTPKGDLKRLKTGYTVLDFAFEIHSEVGSTCTGAIVNDKIVQLKHVLQNGDKVKILTSKNQKPSHDWLDFVKSSRTIAKIKHVLKMENYKDSDQGKEIIKNKVTQLGIEFNHQVIDKLITYFKCENFLELYQLFGEGKLDALKIKKALAEPDEEEKIVTEFNNESFSDRISGIQAGKENYLIIDNSVDMVHYQFARCCNPILGDKIFAFVSVTQGIKIHKTNCKNAKDLITRYPYRVLEAQWKKTDSAGIFTANLKITGKYSYDIVNKLTQFLTHELKINIRSVRIEPTANNLFKGEIDIQVNSRSHLEKIMNRMLRMKEIHSLEQVNAK